LIEYPHVPAHINAFTLPWQSAQRLRAGGAPSRKHDMDQVLLSLSRYWAGGDEDREHAAEIGESIFMTESER
jgi:hypothetical protein